MLIGTSLVRWTLCVEKGKKMKHNTQKLKSYIKLIFALMILINLACYSDDRNVTYNKLPKNISEYTEFQKKMVKQLDVNKKIDDQMLKAAWFDETSNICLSLEDFDTYEFYNWLPNTTEKSKNDFYILGKWKYDGEFVYLEMPKNKNNIPENILKSISNNTIKIKVINKDTDKIHDIYLQYGSYKLIFGEI
jgi:hypothetical protein